MVEYERFLKQLPIIPEVATKIVRIAVDPKTLKAVNEVTFTCGPGNAGYRVDMTSIVLERR